MKKYWKLAVLLVLAVAAVLVWRGVGSSKDTKPAADKTSAETGRRLRRGGRKQTFASPAEAVRTALKDVKIEKKVRGGWVSGADPDRMYAHLKGADRQMAEALQQGLDDSDFTRVASAAEAALKSENPEVRELAVDALGWFGAEALPELTMCMADPDEDVAQAAMNQWEQGLAEIDGSFDRLSIAAAALGTITDANALESLSGHFSNAATEYIDEAEDDENKALERRVEVVQALLDIIEGGNAVRARQAMETYDDITGSRWLGVDEAEKYLRDPDNYEEP